VCHIRSVAHPGSRSVYLASPLGFTAAGRYWYEQVLLPALARHGLTALDPWTNGTLLAHALTLPPGVGRDVALRTASREVASRNFAMVRNADAMLAVLDGTDVDSGTSAEMGYAFALDLPVFALRTDTRSSGDHDLAYVNLQVEECVHGSGGIIGTEVDAVLAALVRALDLTPIVVDEVEVDDVGPEPEPEPVASREADDRPAPPVDTRPGLGDLPPSPVTPRVATEPPTKLGRFTRVRDHG
jgi:nucleoside 2-deoxyribosyltransferase